MKQYFIQFDYWGKGFNKFFFGVVEFDIGESSLFDLCRQIIKDKDHDINPCEAEIRVNAFNNIDVG